MCTLPLKMLALRLVLYSLVFPLGGVHGSRGLLDLSSLRFPIGNRRAPRATLCTRACPLWCPARVALAGRVAPRGRAGGGSLARDEIAQLVTAWIVRGW